MPPAPGRDVALGDAKGELLPVVEALWGRNRTVLMRGLGLKARPSFGVGGLRLLERIL